MAEANARKPPRVTQYNVGRFVLSEDACIASCIDFSAYEQGVSDAADAFAMDPLNVHAPELLESVKELKQLLDMVLCVQGGLPPDANGPAARALAVIAKATGGPK